MPSEVICPTCGRALIIDLQNGSDEPDVPLAAARTIEVVIPGTVSSCDGIAARMVSVAAPEPDSVLGAFVCGDSNGQSHSASNLVEPTGLPPTEPIELLPAPADALSIQQFDLETSASLGTSEGSIETEDRGARWPMVLLGSYASAMTIACLWLVLIGRGRAHDAAPPTIPTDSRPDLEKSAGSERRSLPIPRIPEDHITAMKQPIRLGDLEITPVRIDSGPVTLEHLPRSANAEQRDGGRDALSMHLRLRNMSLDAAFTPLERAFVREPDRGLPDSFIETGRNERIEIYPLAQESEWAIAGQEFPAIKPGDSAEVLIVSDADALGRLANPLTWRVRLRVRPGTTEIVGVRFGVHEVDEGSDGTGTEAGKGF